MSAVRPIVIADYDPAWRDRFEYERAMLYAACGRDAFMRIEHVGSTAVPGLAAKPIVDMMPGVRSLDAFAQLIPSIESLGYEYVPAFERDSPAGAGMPFRRYFRKDLDGVRAFHLHCVEVGSEFWRDHLLFRNWLRFHSDDVDAYASLKRRLADEYNRTMLAEDVDINVGYTDYKTELIEAIKAKARANIERATPIVIRPHDEAWSSRYTELHSIVAAAVGDEAAGIEHIGSTSVPGLVSMPTIDIAVGVRSMETSRSTTSALLAAGFAKGRDNFPDWRYFDLDRNPTDDNVHLHVVPFGGERWNRYLLFRNYLRANGDMAARYADLKRALAAEFGKDRLGYVEAKSDFVEMVQRRAREP